MTLHEVNKVVVASSRELFTGLFPSVPEPLSKLPHSALQLPALENLHIKALSASGHPPLSRTVLDLLHVKVSVAPQQLDRIPRNGPLLVVANHPFGILDGLMLDAILFDVRPDVKILANSLMAGVADIGARLIPVDVLKNPTCSTNLRSVRRAAEWLREGHLIAIFPSGEVSHWRPDQRCISDPPWSTLPARLALRANAAVMPVYFPGANSFAFQLAGLLHPRLRTARLPRELLNKTGSTIEVQIGSPIPCSDFARQRSIQNVTTYLRGRTYMLGHGNAPARRSHSPAVLLKAPQNTPIAQQFSGLENEIAQLESRGCLVLENSAYAVFAERGAAMPALLHEIGRLREITFRAEFQKDYAPLMLLWQAIGRQVASRPSSPVLFGAVSISANYSAAAVELIVQYLRSHRLRSDLTCLLTPRRPFRSRLTHAAEIRMAAACLSEMDDLATLLGEIEHSCQVPVLLRQYVRLGGRVAAFNVDRNFSNVLDGLLIVDLRETAPKLLAKYMGADSAAAFLRSSCPSRSA